MNEKKKITVQDVLNGNIFNHEAVREQRKLFALILIMIIIYIFQGFAAQKQQARIVQLNKEIQDAHYEYLTVNAELVKMSRQSVIGQRLHDAGSKVKESNTPAIRIQ